MHEQLNLRLVAGFLAVVDLGSVSAAADQLNLTQPALSRQIQQLERQLGLQLFDRTPTRLVLSAGGQRFIELARDLLDRATNVQERTGRMAAGGLDHVRVACPEATARGVVAPFVAETGAPILDTMLDLAAGVYAHVSRREVDFAINTLPPPIDLESRLLGTVGVSVFVPADHELARRESVRAREVVEYPLVLLTRESGLRRVIDAALWEVRDRVRLSAEPASSELSMALAAAGTGVCIDLPRANFGLVERPFLDENEERVRMSIYAAWEKSHFASDEIGGIVAGLAAWAAATWG